MAEVRDQPIKLLTMGDELLLGIMELLCMADVLSCSLVNTRLHAVAAAAVIPFCSALKRYSLVYHPYNSPSQSTPDRPLFELLESIHSLNRNWLHLHPTSKSSLQIVDALDDVYCFRDYVVVDRTDPSDSEDEDTTEAGWEIQIYKYGNAPVPLPTASGESGVEIEEDGTIVEEIDAEAHGIDVNAVETDEEDEEEPGPEDSEAEENDSDESGEGAALTTEGVHSVGQFRTTNSFMTAYKVDIAQDLIITSEQWLRAKVKKGARRPARGGLNFSRDTHFLRCLTVTDTKPHPACNTHLGAINVQSLCTENKEDYDDPEDLRIQGPLVSFAVKHSLSHKVVVVNWRDQSRPWTIPLEKEYYLDMHFIGNNFLVILACPISDTDIIRRSLDDENYPIAPRGGVMKLHAYYLGPNKDGFTSPCRVYSLTLPKFNGRWRVDTESAKILPQVSEASSRSLKGAPTVTDGLPYRASDDAGVFCVTFSGVLLKQHSSANDDDDEIGTGWVVDIVVLKNRLLNLAKDAMEKKSVGKELAWMEWTGAKGEHVRVFPHSDEGWLGSPKLYEACSYRVASITPLKRGDVGNEAFPHSDQDGQRERKKVVQADRRMDVLDFCPGRIEDVREALEAKRKQKELEENPDGPDADDGMFGVAAGALLDGEGSEITLVDASSMVEGGPFLGKIQSTLPYILSRFDLDRGRKDDGSLPLPESVWMTETEIILQIEPPDVESSFCPAFDRYTLA